MNTITFVLFFFLNICLIYMFYNGGEKEDFSSSGLACLTATNWFRSCIFLRVFSTSSW